MVGRAAQGDPWTVGEIAGLVEGKPSREDVVAELLLFIHDTVEEMGEARATSFLKKFYGWYLGRGRFPKPFKQELTQLDTLAEVELRLLAAAPGAADVLERLRAETPAAENRTLDLPVSIYAGG
jgi:tRNA-dihydrouridine synthase